MAITTWTSYDTAFVNMASPTDIVANDSTFTLTMPSVSLAGNGPYMESTFKYKYTLRWVSVFNGATEVLSSLQAQTSTYVKKNNYATATWSTPTTTKNTSDFFNSNNPSAKTVSLDIKSKTTPNLIADDDHEGSELIYGSSQVTFATINLTLDAPPTFNVSAISYDKGYVYAGLTTASVTVSNATAQYGGTISSVTLTIGNQSTSTSGNGTLSILLDTVGTFTPTVTVTDSRGQTKTETLAPITVSGYVAPSANISIERTNTSGVADDEGVCAVITANINWAYAIADLTAPTVVVKDLDGVTQTSTTTWYTTRTGSGVSGAISDWSQVAVADMPIYGLVDNTGHNLFNTQYSYTVAVTPKDDISSGATITRTVGSAFYTVDFLAGGHGVAFGQPASQTGFYCNMDTHLLQGVGITGNATITGTTETLDAYIDLPDYQTSSTTDKAIYDAIVALGWGSDVLS